MAVFFQLPLDRLLCLQVTRGNQGAADVDEDGGHLQRPAPRALDTVGPGLGLSRGSDHQVAPPNLFLQTEPLVALGGSVTRLSSLPSRPRTPGVGVGS